MKQTGLSQDAHVHLQDVEAATQEAITGQLESKGVGRIFCNSTGPEDWEITARLSEKSERIKPFFGVHPWQAEKISPGWEETLLFYLKKYDAGIGEIGLDFGKKRIDPEKQKQLFCRQLDIAIAFKKPFVLHSVKAWGKILEILNARDLSHVRWMAHSFSGPVEITKKLLKKGAYLSFSCKALESSNTDMQESFLSTPLDRLLLETDYPYQGLLREGQDPQSRYFLSVEQVYQSAATLRKVKEKSLKDAVWNNGTFFLTGTADTKKIKKLK